MSKTKNRGLKYNWNPTTLGYRTTIDGVGVSLVEAGQPDRFEWILKVEGVEVERFDSDAGLGTAEQWLANRAPRCPNTGDLLDLCGCAECVEACDFDDGDLD